MRTSIDSQRKMPGSRNNVISALNEEKQSRQKRRRSAEYMSKDRWGKGKNRGATSLRDEA